MKNSPLNGYQPDEEFIATADAVEHEIETAPRTTAANAANSPETDAANIDPDTGEIKATADAAADTDTDTKPYYYPTCRFCGKKELPIAPYESQEVADEAATIRCDCYEAKQYQYDLERKKQRDENIKKLRQRLCDFSDYAAARNMEVENELYDFLLNVGTNVLDAKVAGATIKVARFTIKFTVGGKSALSIAFTYSDGGKLEV